MAGINPSDTTTRNAVHGIVEAAVMRARNADATYCEVASTYGHDAFLLELDEQAHLISHFLRKTFEELPVQAAR